MSDDRITGSPEDPREPDAERDAAGKDDAEVTGESAPMDGTGLTDGSAPEDEADLTDDSSTDDETEETSAPAPEDEEASAPMDDADSAQEDAEEFPSEDEGDFPSDGEDDFPPENDFPYDEEEGDFDYDYDVDDVDFEEDSAGEDPGPRQGGARGQDDDVDAFRAASAASRSRRTDARKKRRSRVRLQRGLLIALIACAVLLGAVYVGGCVYFCSHFGFNTTLNGTDVSLMSEEQVEALLLGASEDYVLTIEGRGDVTDTISSAEIDLEPVFDGSIGELIGDQTVFTWPAALFSSTALTSDSTAVFDETALSEVITSLAFFDAANIEEPQDAYYTVTEEGVEIVPETEGTSPDVTGLTAAVTTALRGFASNLVLDDSCYQSAEILSDSEELLSAVEELNALVNQEITLMLTEEESVAVESSEILQWIAGSGTTSADTELTAAGAEDTAAAAADAAAELSGAGTSETESEQAVVSAAVSSALSTSYSFNEELVTAWVESLGDQYDTYGRELEFETTSGQTVTVPGGNYGWLMDREATAAALMELLSTGEGGTLEVVWTQTAEQFGEDDIGDTYIEADLDEQMVYLYVDGELVLETSCVSGKAIDSSRITPNGVYRIQYKKSPSTLVGEGYESYVNYWMPFYYGYGFHDATWRSSFGGEIYLTSGSHGCVNLPKSAAATLYSYVYTGMPVIVFGGMTVEEAQEYTGQTVSSSSSSTAETEEEDTSAEEEAAAAQAEEEAAIVEAAVANYMATGLTEEEARAAVEADLAEQLAAQQAQAALDAQAAAAAEAAASSSDTAADAAAGTDTSADGSADASAADTAADAAQ